jgi:two-component system, LytTR family, sensor kinase
MRKHNCKIGFNDGLLMAVGIPVLSFVVPVVFMGCRFNKVPLLTWEKYAATLFITTVIWLGNRYVMIYSRKKYPLFNDVRKRLIFQSLIMLVFTITANVLLGQLTDSVYAKDGGVRDFTIMIIAIYESIYFMHELRHSVEETENLKRENLSAQLNALRTQVNPHFLFNNLNTLSSLIPENPNHAVDFVQQLSKVYRHILEVKDEKCILLKDELDVLNAYTFLLKTRFDKNLDVNINIPVEKMQKKIVPLSLQILMENAIKHNIVSAEKPLQINVFAENGSLVISNNLQMKSQINESTGIGLDNIRNRYKLISEKPVTVTESETNFTVSIPLIDN